MTPRDAVAASLRAARESGALDAADLQLLDLFARRLESAGGESDPAFQAVAACLLSACDAGSLCLSLEQAALAGSIRAFLAAASAEEDTPASLARAFLANVESGAYAGILGGPGDSRPFVRRGSLLYFHRHFHAERRLAEGLLARKQSPLACDAGAARDALREVLEENPLRAQGPESPALALSPTQRLALAAALRERIFILSGGPGTGKTALTATWLRALLRLHRPDPRRVRLCASTGRAAQRLQESLRAAFESLPAAPETPGSIASPDEALKSIRVETLHRLLGYSPGTGRFARSAADPLQADWVLLDEASMADAFLMSALIAALPPDAALILVGDADQLPAVEAGSILRELLPESGARLSAEAWDWIESALPETGAARPENPVAFTVPSVTLDQSHRSGADVSRLAFAVNAGDAGGVLEILGPAAPVAGGFAPEVSLRRFRAEEDRFAEALPELLREYADAAFSKRKARGRNYAEWLALFSKAGAEEEEALLPVLSEFLSATRILAPARHGPLGCLRVNALLRAALAPAWDGRGMRSGEGFHGAPLLVTRNDAATGLSNGENGIWLETRAGLRACFPREGGWLRLPAAFLPQHETGFATTVHKSQGSEYAEVLLVLPEPGSRLLARETLYTAITRARRSVRVFAPEESLREAVRGTLRRLSGLRDYFKAD